MKRSGFTLIELLVAISIIGLLSSVIVASLNGAREKARLAALSQFEANVYHAIGDSAVMILGADEGTGGTVGDLSGNGNTASFSSSAWTTDTYSGRGAAMSFNNAGQANIVSPKNLPTDEITITAWIKVRQHKAWNHIIQHNWVNDGAWILMVGVDGRAWFGVSRTGNQYNAISPLSSPLSLNQWHLLMGVYDGQTVSLYVDGSKVASATLAGQTLNTTALVYMGSPSTDSDIDNIRVYTRAWNSSSN